MKPSSKLDILIMYQFLSDGEIIDVWRNLTQRKVLEIIKNNYEGKWDKRVFACLPGGISGEVKVKKSNRRKTKGFKPTRVKG